MVCGKINQFDSFCLIMFPLTSSCLSQLAMLDDTGEFVQVRAMSTHTCGYNPLTHQILACIWVNYNDLTATSLEIIVSKGNHPKMALFQVI